MIPDDEPDLDLELPAEDEGMSSERRCTASGYARVTLSTQTTYQHSWLQFLQAVSWPLLQKGMLRCLLG